MVVVTSGKNWKGEPCEFYLDGILKDNLDEVKQVVKNKDWDYVALICGNPGVGKSNFSQSLAKYCCEWFDINYIAFTAEEFIEITNKCPNNSSVALDESFASLNSRISLTSDFIKIINHLQLIRQKNLFVFLCLPNFFDLAKGVSIYRSHHLFVCYSEKFGDRGRFAAFGRDRKRELYIKGLKFMNYNAAKSNFYGRFVKQKAINEAEYMERKKQHLLSQETPEKESKYSIQRDNLITYFYIIKKVPSIEIANIIKVTDRQIRNIIQKNKSKFIENES